MQDIEESKRGDCLKTDGTIDVSRLLGAGLLELRAFYGILDQQGLSPGAVLTLGEIFQPHVELFIPPSNVCMYIQCNAM
jgi:hypothetical protein